MAPDFDVPVLIGGVRKQFRLSEQWGRRNLVLAFYPSNWDPVSTRQMVTYQVERKIEARQAEVLGISVDHIMNAVAWEREIGPFDFLLASDFWPHGAISRRVWSVAGDRSVPGGQRARHFCNRQEGARIRFARIYPVDQLPDFDETFDGAA